LVATAFNALRHPEPPWPYEVLSRKILTGAVEPGGYLIQERIVDYHEDCDIRYERRVQSSGASGRRFIPDDQFFEHPPWDRSGKPQQSSIQIPENFPCGPAYLVETVSVACNWYERTVKRRKKPDIISPFAVACQAPT
jgi:hypothetical protein